MTKRTGFLLTFVFILNIIFSTTTIYADYKMPPDRLSELKTSYYTTVSDYKTKSLKKLYSDIELDALEQYKKKTIPVYFYVDSNVVSNEYNNYNPILLTLSLLEKQMDLKFKINYIFVQPSLPIESQLMSKKSDELCLDIISTNSVSRFDSKYPDLVLASPIISEELYVVSSLDNAPELTSESIVGYDASTYSLQSNNSSTNFEVNSYSPTEANAALTEGTVDFYFTTTANLPTVVENSNLIYKYASTSLVLPNVVSTIYTLGASTANELLISLINKAITSDFITFINNHSYIYERYVIDYSFYTSLTEEEKQYITTLETLDVYYNESKNLLYEFDGEKDGFISEIVNRISDLTNVPVHYITSEELSIKNQTIESNADINLLALYTTEVAEELVQRFSDDNYTKYSAAPVYFSHAMEIMKYYETSDIKSLSELEFSNVGTTNSFMLNAIDFMETNNLNSSELIFFNTEEELVEALNQGTIDYALVPPGTVSFYTDNTQYEVTTAYSKQAADTTTNEKWTLLLHDEDDIKNFTSVVAKSISTLESTQITNNWFPSRPEFDIYNKLTSTNQYLVYLTLFLAVISVTVLIHFNNSRRSNVNRVSEASTIDPVSGLKNAAGFEQEYESFTKGQLIIVYILKCKRANQIYGMFKTDLILLSYADILVEKCGRDNIYRMDGDKFYITIPDNNKDITEFIKELYNTLAKGIAIDNRNYNLGCAIAGADMSLFKNENNILRIVEDLAEECKASPRARYSVLDEKEYESILDKNFIKASLREISGENIYPFFQPFVDAQTEKIKGCEVLARLKINDEIIPAYKFISVAENIGTLGDIDRMLLEKTIALRAELIVHGIIDSNFYFSINFSAQFLRKLTSEDMYELSRRYNVRSFDFLQIEILEEELTRDEIEKIRRIIREFNLHTAIDDFSTGHSTITRLNNFKFDVVKMDRSLLPINFTELDKQIYNSLISMVSSFSKNIVVEGVETEEHVKFLKTTTVSTLQGFYFAKPLPKDEFIEYIINNKSII